jgi:hypothetical protein
MDKGKHGIEDVYPLLPTDRYHEANIYRGRDPLDLPLNGPKSSLTRSTIA